MTVTPLTRAELLELRERGATTNLPMTGRAFGVSEPVIRDLARRGELEASLGVRVLRLGAQYRVPTEDILRVLGITPENEVTRPAPTDLVTQNATTPLKGQHHDQTTSAA